MSKKEADRLIELFGVKLKPEDLLSMILESIQLRTLEKHQAYMFPRGNIDEKTRLMEGEILAGAYIKCAKSWFPNSLGWLLDYFVEIEHLKVSEEGLGRREGVELLTMKRAVRELAGQIKGIPERVKGKGKGEVSEEGDEY